MLFARFHKWCRCSDDSGRSSSASRWKRSECLRVFGDFVGKELQSHEPVQADVLGFVNHTHPAAAKFFHYAVVRKGPSN